MDLSAKGGETIKKFQDNLWDLGLGEECLDQKHDPLKKKQKTTNKKLNFNKKAGEVNSGD